MLVETFLDTPIGDGRIAHMKICAILRIQFAQI